jgi:O-glycosyl hydrolase
LAYERQGVEGAMVRWRLESARRALFALVLLVFIGPRARADGDYRALVDPSIQYQRLQGWGTSLAWWGNVVGGFPEPVRGEYIRKVFDPIDGLGFTVVRYNIGGGENPIYRFMEYRAAVPGFEPTPGVWDWSADANQRWVLDAAIAAGADAVEAFSNSPPYWMTNSGSVTGAVSGGDNLNPAYYDAFADYLSEVVLHFRDQWGISFQTIEPLNEPVSGWWRFGGRQEGCHFDRGSEASIIQRLGASLANKGLSTAVSAPDENTIDLTLGSFRSYGAATRSALSQINTHSYGGSQRSQLANEANSHSKALSMSEYGDGDASGLTMSRRIVSDMKHMRPSSWVYWQAVDGGGWGLLKNALPDGSHTDYTLNKKYFVMANYSRFIRPGYRFIAVTDANSLAAYDPTSRTLILVTTNSGSSDLGVTYDLSTFDTVDHLVTIYRTSADEDLAQLPPTCVVDRAFTHPTKAGSVTTYVLSGVTYTGSIGFDGTSYYKLINVNSGLLLDVSGASISDGAQLIQWPDNGGWNQQWSIVGLGGGVYSLVNRNSGLILDVSNASPDEGANIVQFHDHDASNQQWTVVDLGDGTVQLLHANSALIADVLDGSVNAGARIVQYHDDGGASQRWMLVTAQ